MSGGQLTTRGQLMQGSSSARTVSHALGDNMGVTYNTTVYIESEILLTHKREF